MGIEAQTTPAVEAVGTGTDTLEVNGGVDPNFSRKEIYARANAGQQAEVDIDRGDHPSIDEMSRAMESDGVDPVEEIFAEHGAQVLEQQEREQAERDRLAAEQVEVVDDDGEPTADAPPTAEGTVQLKVFGDTIELPASRVEELGGPRAAQMFLAADYRFRQATMLAKQAQEASNAADAKRREIEELERKIRGHAEGDPPPTQRQGTDNQGAAADEAIRAAAKKLTGEMFSGDPQRIEDALTEVLAIRSPGSPPPAVEDIASLVAARLERDQSLRVARENDEKAKDAREKERLALNALMAEKYGDLVGNPELRDITYAKFSQMRADPRNAGRSLVSIGDECGALVAKALGIQTGATPEEAIKPALQARTQLKRRIPSPSVSADRAPSGEVDTAPLTGSEIVNMLRAARGQTPM